MKDVFRTPIVGQNGARCAHTSTATEHLPENNRHYAKLKCVDCGAFLKFLPKPENVERRRANGFKLTKLQMSPCVTDWERAFIESLAKHGPKFTPRQQAVFDKICAAYLKGGAE